jgi:hypothetical protein
MSQITDASVQAYGRAAVIYDSFWYTQPHGDAPAPVILYYGSRGVGPVRDVTLITRHETYGTDAWQVDPTI